MCRQLIVQFNQILVYVTEVLERSVTFIFVLTQFRKTGQFGKESLYNVTSLKPIHQFRLVPDLGHTFAGEHEPALFIYCHWMINLQDDECVFTSPNWSACTEQLTLNFCPKTFLKFTIWATNMGLLVPLFLLKSAQKMICLIAVWLYCTSCWWAAYFKTNLGID